MMKRTLFLLSMASAMASGVAYAALTVHTIDQNKLQFSVSEIRIKKGDSVRFMNSDRPAHNILVGSGPGMLNSGLQQPGQPFEVPFTKEGTFPVTCGIHPKMRMTVVVE
jgi:plastocyanin